MNWFPFYASDFIGATVGLSCLERAIYALMIPLYYESGPFPRDRVRVYRMIGCESDEQKRAVDFLLGRYFVEMEDGFYQERAEKEKAKQAEISERARQKVMRRWKTDTAVLPQYSRSNTAVIPPTPTPTPTTTTTEEKSKPLASRDRKKRDPISAIGSGEKLIEIPCLQGEFAVHQSMVTEWEEAYPAIDILGTLREIRAWCLANSAKRKTLNGCARFLNAWFAREQNRVPTR